MLFGNGVCIVERHILCGDKNIVIFVVRKMLRFSYCTLIFCVCRLIIGVCICLVIDCLEECLDIVIVHDLGFAVVLFGVFMTFTFFRCTEMCIEYFFYFRDTLSDINLAYDDAIIGKAVGTVDCLLCRLGRVVINGVHVIQLNDEQSAVLGTLCFDRLDIVPAYIAYANAADSEIRKAVISDDESVLGLNCLKEVVECGIREKYNSEDACDVEDRCRDARHF